MKKILAISLVAFLASCGGSDDDIASTGTSSGLSNGAVAEGSTSPGATTAAESNVFLATAYQDGAAEVALSELALGKASNEEVRLFAQRMIDHHTQANEQIRELAQMNGVTLPTGLTDEANTVLQTLTNLAGVEFDRAYLEHNVSVHGRALQLFRGQVATTTSGAGTSGASAEANGTSASADPAGASASVGQDGPAVSAGPGGASATTGTNDASASGGTNGSTTDVNTSGGPAEVDIGGTSGGTTTADTDGDTATEAEMAIRTFAANTLPALQAHLLAAKGLNGAINPPAFLVNLYQDGNGEILLSTLALEKASDPEVRTYAQNMINDHTAANSQITQLAQTKGITLPTETSVEHRAVYEDIVNMEGADFEKAYMNHNVLVHELAVAQAEAQVEQGTDADIRAYAATVAPVLSAHLNAATQIYEAIEPSLLFIGFQDGLGEVLLAKLALQKSAESQVRELAQTIIDDHSRIRADLLQVAQDEGAALPRELSPDQLRTYLELVQLPDEEFDEAYVERNVTVREQDVQLIQQQSAEITDAELRALLDNALSVLSGHVALAQDLARSAVDAATAGTS
jgi:predicted outer membrane protein